MITKNEIASVREQIQNDLLCLLDGLPQEAQTAACEIVVKNMKELFDKAE